MSFSPPSFLGRRPCHTADAPCRQRAAPRHGDVTAARRPSVPSTGLGSSRTRSASGRQFALTVATRRPITRFDGTVSSIPMKGTQQPREIALTQRVCIAHLSCSQVPEGQELLPPFRNNYLVDRSYGLLSCRSKRITRSSLHPHRANPSRGTRRARLPHVQVMNPAPCCRWLAGLFGCAARTE